MEKIIGRVHKAHDHDMLINEKIGLFNPSSIIKMFISNMDQNKSLTPRTEPWSE